MTAAVRLRFAEVAVAAVVISSFLPWTVEDDRTLRGVQVGAGQLIVLTAVATIVMVRLGSRLSEALALPRALIPRTPVMLKNRVHLQQGCGVAIHWAII